ncbi:PLD nuclease N-terminal domain-containing protein [Microbacterium sp. BG28]|uniref:PLD nuclease N-terminal domain-containing protein n=1 Tax=Microbacterium sp. BG28 TaxID=3097356 RepID=UPI002A5AF43B|nr:PLD nuclease N-terminal domain-containing protein [Microbacterium sp. BG28]MDY0830129.1 PLD nuclease N-terminal domain-containing protein [Microbacterium sp. BG28]
MPLLALLIFAMMVVALIDAITRRDDQIRFLPKVAWIFFIVLLPLVGCLLWFTLGREWSGGREAMSFGDPRRWSKEEAAPAPAPRPRDTRTTEQQLADLEREERAAALEAEIRRRRAAKDSGATGA